MISGLANSAKGYDFTEHRFIVILFLIVKFIYSIEKTAFQKEKSHTESVLQISKKFTFRLWDTPTNMKKEQETQNNSISCSNSFKQSNINGSEIVASYISKYKNLFLCKFKTVFYI
jgi:hypothetical protein